MKSFMKSHPHSSNTNVLDPLKIDFSNEGAISNEIGKDFFFQQFFPHSQRSTVFYFKKNGIYYFRPL